MVVMKRTLLLIVAWSTATALAVGVAAAAVGSVRGQVTQVPSVPLQATATSLAMEAATAMSSTTDSAELAALGEDVSPVGDGTAPDRFGESSAPAVDTDSAGPTTTAAPETSDTTGIAGDGQTDASDTDPSTGEDHPETTTTAPPTTVVPSLSTTTTTTTKAQAGPTRYSYDLVGGTVSVDVGEGTVVFVGASPKGGYSVRVENAGPQRVEVRFESETHVSQFSGRFSSGTYVPQIEEHDRHGEDHGDRVRDSDG